MQQPKTQFVMRTELARHPGRAEGSIIGGKVGYTINAFQIGRPTNQIGPLPEQKHFSDQIDSEEA